MSDLERLLAPQIMKFPAAKQRRLDSLLEKNSAGQITAREQATLAKLVAEAERLMVTNAQRLSNFSESARAGIPFNAVPVTVWVAPATAGS